MLRGKKILLGVCGSIAAYKAAVLIRLLRKAEAEVQVIMTDSAKTFISPLTLSTLSLNPVISEFQDDAGTWNNHVEYGLWADLLIIAPATATTMAKMAGGIADNLLNAVYLSAKCPVAIAPAMDLDMFQHPSTSEVIQKLTDHGNSIIEAETGELASGLVGKGRMAEPENIVAYLENFFEEKGRLKGKDVLVTAGPTFEPIDPVRFVGNYSSGKMGLEIAKAAKSEGARVKLILGPTALSPEDLDGIELTNVITAEEMYNACAAIFDRQNIVILAAAVADYTPTEPGEQKIKKKSETLNLALTKTVDIAQTLGEKKQDQFMVGFALETENEIENARKKLVKKNFDFIVLNSLRQEGAGFKHDTNKITIIRHDNNLTEYELKSKAEVAKDIINEIVASLS